MENTVQSQQGSATVEFAILLIPLILLAFGVTEYGRAIYQYNAIAKNVRTSARYLSQYAPGDTVRIAEAKCLVVYGSTTCGTSTLVPGLTTADVEIRDRTTTPSYNPQSTGRGFVNLVSVGVNGYVFTSLLPSIVPNLTFGTIQTTLVQ